MIPISGFPDRATIPAPEVRESRVWPAVVDVRGVDGTLAYRVSAERGQGMVRAGLAEAVGNRSVKYLRAKGAATRRPGKLPRSEANFTVRRRGNEHEHIDRRCNAYAPAVRKAIR